MWIFVVLLLVAAIGVAVAFFRRRGSGGAIKKDPRFRISTGPLHRDGLRTAEVSFHEREMWSRPSPEKKLGCGIRDALDETESGGAEGARDNGRVQNLIDGF